LYGSMPIRCTRERRLQQMSWLERALATLDRPLKRLHVNKAELLAMFDRSEIPLHANGSVSDHAEGSAIPRRAGARKGCDPSFILIPPVASSEWTLVFQTCHSIGNCRYVVQIVRRQRLCAAYASNGREGPPCSASSHSPSPLISRSVLSATRCHGATGGTPNVLSGAI
jgi:hypothetical protein